MDYPEDLLNSLSNDSNDIDQSIIGDESTLQLVDSFLVKDDIDENINYSKLKVTQLRNLLKQRGLKTKGNKNILVNRLKEYDDEKAIEVIKNKTKRKIKKIESSEEAEEDEENKLENNNENIKEKMIIDNNQTSKELDDINNNQMEELKESGEIEQVEIEGIINNAIENITDNDNQVKDGENITDNDNQVKDGEIEDIFDKEKEGGEIEDGEIEDGEIEDGEIEHEEIEDGEIKQDEIEDGEVIETSEEHPINVEENEDLLALLAQVRASTKPSKFNEEITLQNSNKEDQEDNNKNEEEDNSLKNLENLSKTNEKQQNKQYNNNNNKNQRRNNKSTPYKQNRSKQKKKRKSNKKSFSSLLQDFEGISDKSNQTPIQRKTNNDNNDNKTKDISLQMKTGISQSVDNIPQHFDYNNNIQTKNNQNYSQNTRTPQPLPYNMPYKKFNTPPNSFNYNDPRNKQITPPPIYPNYPVSNEYYPQPIMQPSGYYMDNTGGYYYPPYHQRKPHYNPSDPSLVIDMNKVDDESSSHSESENSIHKQSIKMNKELQETKKQILELQRIIKETEEKKKQLTDNSLQQTQLKKRKRDLLLNEQDTPPRKQIKIDIDVTKIGDLQLRINNRKKTIESIRSKLYNTHQKKDTIENSIVDIDTKYQMCATRIVILYEKLKVLKEQQQICITNKDKAQQELSNAKDSIHKLEEEYKTERNILEQESVFLCELEIEKQFSIKDFSSFSLAPPPESDSSLIKQDNKESNNNNKIEIANNTQSSTIISNTNQQIDTKKDMEIEIEKKEEIHSKSSTIESSNISDESKITSNDINNEDKSIEKINITPNNTINSESSKMEIDEQLISISDNNNYIMDIDNIPNESSNIKKSSFDYEKSTDNMKQKEKQNITNISSKKSWKVPNIIELSSNKEKKVIKKDDKSSNIRTQTLSKSLTEKNKLLEQFAEKQSEIKKIVESKHKLHTISKSRKQKENLFSIKLGDSKINTYDHTDNYIIIKGKSGFNHIDNINSNNNISPSSSLLLSDSNNEFDSYLGTKDLGDYISPLVCFRSYRLSPHYMIQGKPIIGPQLVFNIDPSNILCRFEMHGTCNDDECPYAHFKDCTRSPAEIIELCATYAKLRTNKNELEPHIISHLKLIHQKIGKVSTESLICNFVQSINKLITDSHYIPLIRPPNLDYTNKNNKVLNQAPISSTTLLGISKTQGIKSSNNPNQHQQQGRVSTIEFSEPFDNLLQHDIVPLYDNPKDINNILMSCNFDKRYYRLSKQNYEKLVEKEPNNISLWLHYALSKVNIDKNKTNINNTKGYYESICILVLGLEKNPYSKELWRLYLDYFSRCGTMDTFTAVLAKATNYVPSSYSIWFMRWTNASTIEQKLHILNSGISTFLKLQDISLELKSKAITQFILSSICVLYYGGYNTFINERLKRFFKVKYSKHEKIKPTSYPFESANKFLSEHIISDIWNILTNNDICILVIHSIYLIIFDKISLNYQSFTKQLNSFTIIWKDLIGKKQQLNKKIKQAMDLFQLILNPYKNQILPNEFIPIAINYIGMLENLYSIEKARSICKELLVNSQQIIELWQIYGSLEYKISFTVGEMIFKKSLNQFRNSYAFWYYYASLLVSLGYKDKAISVLITSVSNKQIIVFSEPTKIQINNSHKNFKHHLESSQNNDVFLWLSYCLFLSLNKISAQNIFERALLKTFQRSQRKLLFLEYIRWQISQDESRSHLLDTLDRIFNYFGPDIESPFKDEILDELLHHKTMLNIFIPPSTEDYSYLDEIVNILIDYFPDNEGKELVLNLYLQRFPRNIELHVKLGELCVKQNQYNKARKAFTAALKLFPEYLYAWEQLINLELKNNIGEVSSLLLSALEHLPESKILKEKQKQLENILENKK